MEKVTENTTFTQNTLELKFCYTPHFKLNYKQLFVLS